MQNDDSTVSLDTFINDLKGYFPAAVEAARDLLAPPSAGWITVATNAATLIVSYLTDPGLVDALESSSFHVAAGFGMPALDRDGVYLAVGSDPRAIPLVFHRRFRPGGLSPPPPVLELAEDFRLFWNLYEDRHRREFICDDVNGDQNIVARVTDTAVELAGPFVRRYLAARQVALVRQFTVDARGGGELDPWNGRSETTRGPFHVLEAWGGATGSERYIRCQGIHIELPPTQDTCGVWPFEAAKTYLDFIVDVDELGNEIFASSHAAYDGDRPFYLTPVSFTRSVLDRYHADPDRFSVEDGAMRGPTWMMDVDNGRDDDVVVAFLGDLGRDLPEREAQHWRAHNIPPDERGMSETAVRRNFLAIFADSTRVEHRFGGAYKAANTAWKARFGWPLYKDPHAGDGHVLTSLHVPTNRSVKAFDEQIVLLAKATVDFLNEAEITAALPDKVANERGITKLEPVLTAHGLDSGGLPDRLRTIQGARTNSAAHRKGEDFDRDVLLGGHEDLPALFTALLNGLTDGLTTLTDALAADPAADGR